MAKALVSGHNKAETIEELQHNQYDAGSNHQWQSKSHDHQHVHPRYWYKIPMENSLSQSVSQSLGYFIIKIIL
jgi:ABC-type Zn2+ transport system substrate-binding protein/surface adhesin